MRVLPDPEPAPRDNAKGATQAVPPCKTWQARIHSAQELGEEIVQLTMKLTHGLTMQFLAGQQVRMRLADGSAQVLSIASAPRRGGASSIDVHLRVRAWTGSEASVVPESLAKVPPVQAEVLLEGPFGSFVWHDDQRPAVLLASDCEFTALKSMVEHAFDQHVQRPVHIYWGVQSEKELYLESTLRKLVELNDHIYYTPVLRSPRPNDNWLGRTGDACDALIEDLPDLSAYRIYLSADPVHGSSMRQKLLEGANADPAQVLASWRDSH